MVLTSALSNAPYYWWHFLWYLGSEFPLSKASADAGSGGALGLFIFDRQEVVDPCRFGLWNRIFWRIGARPLHASPSPLSFPIQYHVSTRFMPKVTLQKVCHLLFNVVLDFVCSEPSIDQLTSCWLWNQERLCCLSSSGTFLVLLIQFVSNLLLRDYLCPMADKRSSDDW